MASPVPTLSLGFEIEFLVYSISPTLKESIVNVINATGLGRARVKTTDFQRGDAEWLVGHDESLLTLPGEQSIEIASPPFLDIPGLTKTNNEWRAKLRGVMRAVNQQFQVRTDPSAGLHVHLGVGLAHNSQWTIEGLRKLALVFTLVACPRLPPVLSWLVSSARPRPQPHCSLHRTGKKVGGPLSPTEPTPGWSAPI